MLTSSRDWRIYVELAQRLITKARALYVDEDFGVELANTVYALDATTIDLCLSMFPWAPFCSTKAAVKLHTLLDLRGSIPTFIHISDGKMHDVNVLDLLLIEAGAFYIMDRGYLDFERLYALDQAGGFFITRAKRNLDARRVYSAPVDRDTGLICDQTIALNGFYADPREDIGACSKCAFAAPDLGDINAISHSGRPSPRPRPKPTTFHWPRCSFLLGLRALTSFTNEAGVVMLLDDPMRAALKLWQRSAALAGMSE